MTIDKDRTSMGSEGPGEDDTTFKREGPPPSNNTGSDVESMNRAAARAMKRNVRPEPSDATERHDDDIK